MWGPGGYGCQADSELILLFLYLGYIALWLPSMTSGPRASGGVLILVGVVNIPIIHYSVECEYAAPRLP